VYTGVHVVVMWVGHRFHVAKTFPQSSEITERWNRWDRVASRMGDYLGGFFGPVLFLLVVEGGFATVGVIAAKLISARYVLDVVPRHDVMAILIYLVDTFSRIGFHWFGKDPEFPAANELAELGQYPVWIDAVGSFVFFVAWVYWGYFGNQWVMAVLIGMFAHFVLRLLKFSTQLKFSRARRNLSTLSETL
jgi:hypothetical protein